MNRASDQLFASACLALDQYSGACWRNSFDAIEHRIQRRTIANELFEFARARTLITAVTLFEWLHGKTPVHPVPFFPA
jgi:hypothetical protein